MPEATSNHTTVPTRRRFLSQAAGVAAGGSILALAAIPPASAVAAPAGSLDPVFGLIEAHRTASAAHSVAVDERPASKNSTTRWLMWKPPKRVTPT